MEVYLNNAATSWPKPECVYEAVNNFLRRFGASQGRGVFRRSQEATRIIEDCRDALARLFNVKDPSRLVFTKNCSEALNLAIKGFLRPGDHVITSSMEHNSVWRPLKTLEKKGTISLSEVMCNPHGEIDLSDVKRAFRPETRLLVFTHASNVTGTLFPLAELAELAHAHSSRLLVDAAQTAGVFPIDVAELGIDLLACSGHKGLLGPQGTGALYIAPGLELEPLLEGGTGSNSLFPFQPETLPDRFETGIPNGPGLAGLGAAVEFLLKTGVAAIREKEHQLTALLLEKLGQIPGVVLYGPRDPDRQVAVVSFNIQDVNPEEVGAVLDEIYNIMVRTGLHCAPRAHRTIGTLETGTVRVSPGYFNTVADIEYFLEAIREIARKAAPGPSHPVRPGKEGAAAVGEFVKGYQIIQAAPCYADARKIRVIASLTDDVETLFPYLNAVLRGSYHEAGKSFTFSYEGRPVVLQPRQIILGKTENIAKANEILENVVKMLNRVAAARDRITPTTEPQTQLSPFMLYKHLPRTNCRECGELTCLAFATGVIQGRYEAEQCPFLKEPAYAQQKQAIEKLLAEYLEGLLPAGEELLR
ncbi:MAG: aminotransferase class V-fold PLP-dependent enzyme [Firmicutes bacterium]|nr:aminotransferase class V-fold PLP-dependent enzyme [Bacillota bacterium]NPV30304.1 aminotransferase class V-fold PLP-dependent enzyme [Bacillota bacterium]